MMHITTADVRLSGTQTHIQLYTQRDTQRTHDDIRQTSVRDTQKDRRQTLAQTHTNAYNGDVLLDLVASAAAGGPTPKY